MVTQAEVEAASSAIVNANDELSPDTAAFLATLALEAAERVRPHKTSTERVHRHRARKRAARNVSGMVGNVSGGATPAAANGETLPETLLATAGNVSALDRLAALYAKLIDAAGGNVHPAATDISPIERLLEQGCDLDVDVLPAVRDLLTDPLQPPLKRWDLSWLAAEITRRRDERTGHVTPAAPARDAPVRHPAAPPRRSGPPAAPSLDMDELVAGYRAGNVAWDAARFGSPPGSPGCRVDAAVLRENGYG